MGDHPLGNVTYTESSDRVQLSADELGIENAVLTIDAAVLDDRAFYNCTATNDAILYGNADYVVAMESTYVRVKGLCYYYPPFGACD